jgi:acetylglutamate kinase
MGSEHAEVLIREGTIGEGMIPKVECCIAALRGGVKKTHIIDGRVRHATLLEIFTKEGIGTEVVRRTL